MALPWITLPRTVSRKSFIAILIVSAFFISLHTIFEWPFHLPNKFHPFELDLAWMRPGQVQDGPSLGKHTLTPDGLLVTNTNGPHPILQLIRDAEAAWERKHVQASKTLDEAVAEYRRRYRRSPPLGFDKWWDYVVKHRVLLPDEYDQIYEDLEPFWGIDPHELALIQQEYEAIDMVTTMQKTKVHPGFQVVHSTLPPEKPHLQARIDHILSLVSEVEHDLPPLRITFSPSDGPSFFSSWQAKTMALEAAANGTTLTRADFPPVTEPGWIYGCSPDSSARRNPSIYPPQSISVPPSSPKTFVASHRDTMDPCMHPSLFTAHGQFLKHKTGPLPGHELIPRFSLCATLLHHDIRQPVPYAWDYDADEDADEDGVKGEESRAFDGDVPWERKMNGKLDWRGRVTGMHASPDTWWIYSHRQRLVTLTNSLEGNVSVLPVSGNKFEYGMEAEKIPVGEPESVPLALINPDWMDVAFTDKPVSCDEGTTCDEMARMWPFLKLQERHEEGQYKFILDVDGHAWSGRFKRLITSNALIFKSTIYPEWYTLRIAPWVHYVPIQVNYADLYDTVAFFREYDELGGRIARAGRTWSRRYWRKADMAAYLYRLLLEYARVMSLDREAMDYGTEMPG